MGAWLRVLEMRDRMEVKFSPRTFARAGSMCIVVSGAGSSSDAVDISNNGCRDRHEIR